MTTIIHHTFPYHSFVSNTNIFWVIFPMTALSNFYCSIKTEIVLLFEYYYIYLPARNPSCVTNKSQQKDLKGYIMLEVLLLIKIFQSPHYGLHFPWTADNFLSLSHYSSIPPCPLFDCRVPSIVVQLLWAFPVRCAQGIHSQPF